MTLLRSPIRNTTRSPLRGPLQDGFGGLVDNAVNLLGDGLDLTTANGWTHDLVTVTANAATDPFGDVTAELITNGASMSNYRIRKSFNVEDSAAYNASHYFKANTDDAAQIVIFNEAFSATLFSVTYDIGTDTLSGPDVGVSTATDEGNGWYRLSGPYTASGTLNRFFIRVGTGPVGTPNSSAYFSGVQVTRGAALLPYRSS